MVLSNESDRVVFDVTRQEAARLIRLRQARWVEGKREHSLRLTGIGEAHPCRTHISRGGVLAAIGRSQVYTTAETSASGTQVYGFKRLDISDAPFFGHAPRPGESHFAQSQSNVATKAGGGPPR